MLRSVNRHKDNRYTTGPERDAPIINGRALAGLSLTMLMSSLKANVALPSLARMFAVSFQAAQWIVLAYLLTVAAMVVIAGRVGDVVGRRRLLLAGTTVFAGGSLLCGLAKLRIRRGDRARSRERRPRAFCLWFIRVSGWASPRTREASKSNP